jgi:hypothetical protein
MWVVVSSGPTEGRIKEEFLEILKHGADVEWGRSILGRIVSLFGFFFFFFFLLFTILATNENVTQNQPAYYFLLSYLENQAISRVLFIYLYSIHATVWHSLFFHACKSISFSLSWVSTRGVLFIFFILYSL